MPKTLFSASWYRVAGFKPRLRTHVQIHRQRVRGQTWYVLQDEQSGQFHRLSSAAHWMVCMMDGRRTMRELWEGLGARMREGEEQPTQDEIVRLLAQLHHADLLSGSVPPDMAELSERWRKHRRRELMTRMMNPMAVRIPVFDPERFLVLTAWLVRPMFTVVGFSVWALIVAAGVLLAYMHWEALSSDAFATAFSAQNLLLIACVYPLVKAIHEFGHAYAVKIWGGEVHEMGVMFLVLMPVPYVDASAASAFQDKWRRALVASAGIMVEALLAALAIIFWVLAEPGPARALAFNVALIAGVSTALFNGNPLLRFDGYYALCDVSEIPNLGTRANRYFFYLARRLMFGIRGEDSPAVAPGEPQWFFVYAIASFLYRMFIMLTIALFIASKLFFIGVALALFAIAHSIVWPVLKGVHYIATSATLRHHRKRGLAVLAVLAASAALVVFAVPLPYSTLAQGVVQPPDNARIHALTNGFVTGLLVAPGTHVEPGEPLIAMESLSLAGQLATQRAALRELEVRHAAANVEDRTEARQLEEQIQHARADVALIERRQADLTIKAPGAGRFIVSGTADWPGRYVGQGALLGYVLAHADPVARVVVGQDRVDLVRKHTRAVAVRRVEDPSTVIESRIVQEAPMAQRRLPSAALATSGGGDIVVDPTNTAEAQALEGLFSFDLALDGAPGEHYVGSRVHARFDHGTAPLARSLFRAARQLFLSRLGM